MRDVDGTESHLVVDDASELALKDVSAVRVTAIVKSDSRVAYDANRRDSAGSSQTIAQTIQSERFRWVTRHSSSAYADEGRALCVTTRPVTDR